MAGMTNLKTNSSNQAWNGVKVFQPDQANMKMDKGLPVFLLV